MQVGWLQNILRFIFPAIDKLGYFLLGAIYDIFFVVANAKILQGDFIVTFYARVQLILGVFMMFRLTITILQIIVNPDLAKDKNKGASKILMRVVLSLVMLTLIAPINIPNDDGNPLNQQIADNGILFGFLYQIQNTVVEDNVLGKLILGSDVDNISNNNNSLNLNGIGNVGDTLAATVAKAFVRPTLASGVSEDDITDQASYEENLACEDIVKNQVNYFSSTTPYQTILDGVSESCNGVYAFDYTVLGGLIVSIVMFLIVLGFTVDIAVRAIKLALLRLIAPIPIIAYIDPGQEKNGAFGSWVKTLTSTYLDLFIRLAVVYFGIYIIVSLTQTSALDLFPSSPNFFTSTFATIFIILGILVFMKQAPKFFKDMLGIKGDGNFKLFGGLGTIAAAGLGVAGIAGAVATNARTSYEEGRMAGHGKIRSALSAIPSGAVGGVAGAFTGAKALATADKNPTSAVLSAMQKRNALRASHSTLPGRIADQAYGVLTGRSLADKDQNYLEANQEAVKQLQNWKKFTEDEATKKGDYGVISTANRDMVNYFATNGLDTRILGTHFNYAVLRQRIAAADSDGNFEYNGVTYNSRDFDTNVMGEILKSQNSKYVSDVFSGAKDNPGILSNWELAKSALNKADIGYNGDYLDPKDIGKTIGIASGNAQKAQTMLKHVKHRANRNANKSK